MEGRLRSLFLIFGAMFIASHANGAQNEVPDLDSIQNIESVKVSFIVWSVNAPQVFVILGTYVLGMLTGWGLVEVLKRTLREKS